jgi:epoxyqueuosine reductase
VGFTSVAPFPEDAAHLDRWRAAGRHGEMHFLTDPADRTTPRALLPTARTIISVALPHARNVAAGDALCGSVARYAQGADYHAVLKQYLRELADRVAGLAGPLVARACVDTAPITEHAAAARAGVGFAGRNTLTIVPGAGSYVLLGELLVDVQLLPDAPVVPRCGRCTRCLDACPTSAFVGPYELDARRCISYLTIELRGSIPHELRPLIGTRVFGCDACQEVCPYNRPRRPPPPAAALRPRPALQAPDLVELLWLGSAAHRRLTRGTALQRVSRTRLARNAAVALGNCRDVAAIEPVAEALTRHPSSLVRGHAAWALARLDDGAAGPLLERASRDDPDEFVRTEARAGCLDPQRCRA